MRVLFIYPSIDTPVGLNHGLAAISGVLRSRGHETGLVHVCEGLEPVPSSDEILERVRAFNPDVIGFSCMSQQHPWAVVTARHLREAGVTTPIVVGGVHCTMVPEDVVDEGCWDAVFVGECEDSFAEYVGRLEAGGDVTTVPGLWTKVDGRIVRNDVGPFPDLTTLAPKDYDLFDIGKILDAKKGWMSILTSRGCPYKCTYCFNREIVARYRAEGAIRNTKEYLRHYDAERIVGEIAEMNRRFPGKLKTVIFDDDLFTVDRRYVLAFCEAYRAAKLDIPFVVNAHPLVFDDEIAGALKDAGCFIVKYGLESGSRRVRKEVLQRHMSNERIRNSFAAAHRQDLHTSAFIMAGLPTETRAEIEETLQLCADVEMGRFRWAIFYPFPGTVSWTMSRDLGLIDEEKARTMGNYFDGSCLDLGEEMNLYIEKLTAFCHWYVNARTTWPSRPIFEKLVAELDALDRPSWESRRPDLLKHDESLSESLMADDVLHYSRQFSPVMGVRSDFVKQDRETTYTLD
jgi:radical SAM superfamily enzyme YgiQ (UPF0313 family)